MEVIKVNNSVAPVHPQCSAVAAVIQGQGLVIAQKETHGHQQSLLTLPEPLTTSNLLSVSKELPILDISYKRSHTLCDLLGLAYFT